MDSARPRSLSFYRVRRHCAMDPAWIHDGSDVSDFTKPYVFTGILLGSTMGPRWFPSWDNCETMCFHKAPAWIHDGSDLAHSTKPYVFTRILLGSTMDPRWCQCREFGETICFHLDPAWIHDGSDLALSTKPFIFTGILLGSTMAPRWFPCWEVTRPRVKSPRLRCLERKTQSKLTFAPV